MTAETEELETTEIPVDPQDTRRWVQIGDGDGSWHLISADSLGTTGSVETQCGLETTNHLYLDRLPGGENDNALIDPDCAKILGIEVEEEDEQPSPKKATPKSK